MVKEKLTIVPKIGDFWYRKKLDYFAIVDVKRDKVVICDKKIDLDADTFTFDVSDYKILKKTELMKRIRDDLVEARVIPNRCAETAQEWKLYHKKV